MAQEQARNAIARRAYERYEERGGNHGRDVDDWLESERELGGVLLEASVGGGNEAEEIEAVIATDQPAQPQAG